jgi:hypothetical protein
MGRKPLNASPEWTGEVRTAEKVALALQMKMLALQVIPTPSKTQIVTTTGKNEG